MKKIIELEPSFYRLNLGAGNMIYFSHARNVRDDEYVTLSAKDIIEKIDELVEAYNSIAKVIPDLGDTIQILKTDVESLKVASETTPKISTEDLT